jgi:hypothetical protein
MSGASAAQAPIDNEFPQVSAGKAETVPRPRLRIAGGPCACDGATPLRSRAEMQPPAVPAETAAGRSAPAGSAAEPVRTARLRLTPRGRVVVAGLIVAAAAVIALIAGLAAPGGAQASNHSHPGGGHQGMHQVVVQPGQTLWSIASAAEPSADPRRVVDEIMAANAMTGAGLQSGQLLWVPR